MQSLSNLESGTLWLIRQEVSGTLVLEPGHGFLPTQQEHWTPNWGKATREHGSIQEHTLETTLSFMTQPQKSHSILSAVS